MALIVICWAFQGFVGYKILEHIQIERGEADFEGIIFLIVNILYPYLLLFKLEEFTPIGFVCFAIFTGIAFPIALFFSVLIFGAIALFFLLIGSFFLG